MILKQAVLSHKLFLSDMGYGPFNIIWEIKFEVS